MAYNRAMSDHLDPETLKIPAFMRNKAIVSQAKQKLILTALDRKDAGLAPNSKKATATVNKSHNARYNQILNSIAGSRKEAKLSQTPRRRRRKKYAQSEFSSPTLFSAPTFDAPLIEESSNSNRASAYGNNAAYGSSSDYDTPSATTEPSLPEKLIVAGTITHYLNKIDVAIIKLTQTLKIGDFIYIQTEDGLTLQQVEEMQIERRPVLRAKSGDHIGLKVREPAMIDGKIFKLEN